MATTSIAGNAQAKRGLTVLAIRTLAVLCLLGVFGALMAKVSDGWELDPYRNEGVVSKARVLDSKQDTSTIVWNNGDRGQASYNFLHVVTDPANGMPFADFTRSGQEPVLPGPPIGEPSDEQTRTISVTDESVAAIKGGDVVNVVTHRYDSSGGMLLSEITGRDYTLHYVLMAIFAALAAGLWVLGSRIKRSAS